ncbi:hypothetical protein WMF18_36155 [Sorangium sp. So ce315]|uniref:hypothetical protein n=1 Tax=Sorangium sp. So ce315 TaxID=3133299 RepID=UPI003F61518B
MATNKKTSRRQALASVFVPGTDPLAFAPPVVTTLSAQLAGFKAEPHGYDPELAEELVATYRPRLTAITPDRLEVPRIDIESVSRALLTVHALTQAPPLLALYRGAAAQGEFQLDNLDHLKALAIILLHAYRQADAAGAFTSGAKLSAALDKESAEVEARLQKVCEHFFGDDPDLAPVLRRLSAGTGYLDRAYDLLGYADIYQAKQDVVSTDPVHYRATDLTDARRLASQMLAVLGAALSPKAREAYDLLQRAWTLAKPLYVEVQELGLRFLRYDPQRDARFPSLYVVGRTGQGRKKTKKEAAAPAGGDTTSSAGGGAATGAGGGAANGTGAGTATGAGGGAANGVPSGATAGAGGGATSGSGGVVSPATRGAEKPAPV